MTGELQLESADERNLTDSDPLLENPVDSSSPVSSTEIRNEDIENVSAPCCRICLECDGEEDDELISPCMCKGTQQFVHRACLDHWRSVRKDFPSLIVQLARLGFTFELNYSRTTLGVN